MGALGRAGWIGRRTRQACVGSSLLALLCLVIMAVVAFTHPDDSQAIFHVWYAIPDFIFSIPAVSFIIPSLFGVILLRRAGDQAPMTSRGEP